jgi:hypothetical protein
MTEESVLTQRRKAQRKLIKTRQRSAPLRERFFIELVFVQSQF